MGCEKPFVASRENDTEKSEVRMQRKVDRTEELKRLRERYQGRGKEGKSRLLTEFCEQYGYERKYAIKLWAPLRRVSPEMRRRGPSRSTRA